MASSENKAIAFLLLLLLFAFHLSTARPIGRPNSTDELPVALSRSTARPCHTAMMPAKQEGEERYGRLFFVMLPRGKTPPSEHHKLADVVRCLREATSAFNEAERLHLLIYNNNARLELLSMEGLAELPPGRRHVVAGDRPAVAGRHLEREALPVQVRVALPVLAPVVRHPLPPCLRPLYRHSVHVAGRAHVGDQHQDEVGVAIDGEPYSSLLRTGHPVRAQ
ncbi:hypothetical protein B296_00031995 [Ensete ventricosum]|uniref:Inhibitor I9 domain-containing protein n=1 Tax=Ensete ventricosum TaxID=4639 RepID=A0A426XKP2_ENSVE|nr:hypothetical protein B296_00031995 [Ensete ventricosum]